MKVVATDLGFYGGARKRKGDVFDVPDTLAAAWFKPLEAKAEEPKPHAAPSGGKRTAARRALLAEPEGADLA